MAKKTTKICPPSIKDVLDDYFAGDQLKTDMASLKGEARVKLLLKLAELQSDSETTVKFSDPLIRMFKFIRAHSDDCCNFDGSDGSDDSDSSDNSDNSDGPDKSPRHGDVEAG